MKDISERVGIVEKIPESAIVLHRSRVSTQPYYPGGNHGAEPHSFHGAELHLSQQPMTWDGQYGGTKQGTNAPSR